MQRCRFMLLLHQRENNKWKKIRTPVFQHYLMMPELIPFIKSTFKKSLCQLETNPICPVKGALLQFLAWHEAAGGEKNPSSQTVKRRPHTGAWTCLAELREPAGVGVSTAALQIKQRAAHDSSGWMPWNTARRTSRSIHCVWPWKRYPEPQPLLCLFSMKLLSFYFASLHKRIHLYMCALFTLPSDSPHRSFSCAAGHVARNPAFSTQSKTSVVFYTQQTVYTACHVTLQRETFWFFLLQKNIISCLITPKNLFVILFSCGQHLQESPFISTWSKFDMLIQCSFTYFKAIYCRSRKTFLPENNQERSTSTSNQMGMNSSFTRLRVIPTSCLGLLHFLRTCFVIRIRGVAQCLDYSSNVI